MGQASFYQRVAARLWPGIELLRHLVSLQVESERFVEVEYVEMDTANNVGNPGEPDCISRLRGIVAELLIPPQRVLIGARGSIGIANEDGSLAEQEPCMREPGELHPLMEIPEAAVEH